MKTYVVTANIELEATTPEEAEDIVLGMDLVALDGTDIDFDLAIEGIMEVE